MAGPIDAVTLQITLLGRGAWGETLERLWRNQGNPVSCWSRRDGGDPESLLGGADLVVCAVSMAGVPPLAKRLAPHWPPSLPLLSCSKGIDLDDHCTASQIWRRHLGDAPIAVLSGPNLAGELDRGLPAASVIAGDDPELAERLQLALGAPHLRLYTNSDPIGTEVAGALKNAMAVAAGICDGLGLGANAKASLLCRGLAEIGVVLKGLGGEASTLFGLAGLGDLLATANSSLSRNYRFGGLLAEGWGERGGHRAESAPPLRVPARPGLWSAWRSGGAGGCRSAGRSWPFSRAASMLRGAVQALMERELRPEAER